jgi:hypothetical protein
MSHTNRPAEAFRLLAKCASTADAIAAAKTPDSQLGITVQTIRP